MYARMHTLSTISTQESSQAGIGPVKISKSIYSLKFRAITNKQIQYVTSGNDWSHNLFARIDEGKDGKQFGKSYVNNGMILHKQ